MKFEIASGGYCCEPNLIQCADGSFLCVYRKGSAHVSNDGAIVAKRSADGETWGPEFVIYDVPGKDTRNPCVGVDASGRVVLFCRTLIAPSTHDAIWHLTSDDHGSTWSVPQVVSAPLGVKVPFGPMVSTSRGLLVALYVQNVCVVMRSTDGGLTFGDPVTVYATGLNEQVEPSLSAHGDKVALLIRCDTDRNAFVAFTSQDGGATWKNNGKADWTATAIDAACPFRALVRGDDVLVTWAARYQHNKVFAVQMAAQAFFEDPKLALVHNAAYPSEPRTVLATAHRRHTGVTTATDYEFGYAYPLEIDGRALIAWYDTTDGTNTNCTIWGQWA